MELSNLPIEHGEIFLVTSQLWFGCKPKLLAQTVKMPRRFKAIVFPLLLKKSNILLITTNMHTGEKVFKIFSSEWLLRS